ncbi:MAG: hypothetical protein ACRC4J_00910, partial [Cetobacterium sp.]
MPILTATDQPIYFPSVTLTGLALEGFLRRIQVLAEGPWGARRSLELQAYTQKIRINRVYQNAKLLYWPLSDLPAPIVSVRQSAIATRFGRSYGTTPWTEIDPSQYLIDNDGLIHLQLSSNLSWGHDIGTSNATEMLVSYTAGFDFTQDTPDVRTIKSVLGNFASFVSEADGLSNPTDPADELEFVGLGTQKTPFGPSTGAVESWEVDDALKITYADKAAAKALYGGSNPGASYRNMIEALLMPLRKYYPRSF